MISRILVPIGLAMLLSACGELPATDQRTASVAESQRDTLSGAPGHGAAAPRAIEDTATSPPALDTSGLVAAPSADDSATLVQQVRRRCREEPSGMSRRDNLKLVVGELFAFGIPPAEATEALIRADCAGPGAIVREMVEQGGYSVVAPVTDRALLVLGPGFEEIVEAAASTGLESELDPGGVARTTSRPSALYYAMVYFPSGGKVAQLQQSSSLSQLFGVAEQGYGIYTYVVSGAGVDDGDVPNSETYRELLRVIETYVISADGDGAVPRQQAHSFLVPVDAARAGESLLDQTGPELSAHGRKAYAVYLESQGQRELARRLLTRPGPFLVSSLEPRLIPSERSAPRLVVDLSDVGAEYMFSVVDAYDRAIPESQVGSLESLQPIRSRLIDLMPDAVASGVNRARTAGDWVYMLGPRQIARAAYNVNQPGETANGG